jgi:hypothetical protein
MNPCPTAAAPEYTSASNAPFLSTSPSHPLRYTTPESTATTSVGQREDSVTKDRSAIKQKSVTTKDEEAAKQKPMADVKATFKVTKVTKFTKPYAEAKKTTTNTTINVHQNAPRTDTELEVARTLAGLSRGAHSTR